MFDKSGPGQTVVFFGYCSSEFQLLVISIKKIDYEYWPAESRRLCREFVTLVATLWTKVDMGTR